VNPSTSHRRSTRPPRALIALVTSGALVFVPASSAASPTATACPPASVVGAALKQKDRAPTSSTTPFSKTCTYAGTGLVPTKITFQKDTAATFAAGEKAASAIGIVKVPHLGQAAWTTKAGGDLEVYASGETVKILSPLTPAAALEALARKLI
jgi:hypothetical protein